MIHVKKITFLYMALFLSVTASAAVPAWRIVPADSTLTFTATQNNAPVSGNFKTFGGEITFDPAQLAASHVQIVVDVGSVNTSYGEIADSLKSPDWFNVKLFPQAVFKANQFTKTGDNTYQANGRLTIRNKTVPVTLTFILKEFSKTKALVEGMTTLKRSLFSLGQGEWANTDAVKDEVQVKFKVVAEGA